ncbi:alpha/beta hydrolase family protein [Haloferax sp. YSMS24]|uniref:alpha/beta hydrolase family protein n=1 Tax=Haloferax sp. YSMS24 TaxID=3388425 RepID=UPI00398D31F2
MEGFDDAVNGYFDVADQLSRYFLSRAERHFTEARTLKFSTTSRERFEARRARVREQFLSQLGGLPERLADSPVDVTGRIEHDEYSIELLTFESRPNFHVTANCYVPDDDGPHPGILFPCGHTDAAKADELTQKACIELARNGFVVLVFDPISQGERVQYVDSETGEPTFPQSGGVFAHCYAGQKCFYAGGNLARYVIHDARCALDYLTTRADVDDGRIGVTGASGGGVQTMYLALVDDRIDVIAPCCSVTDRREWLQTGNRIDAEQLVYGAITRGIDHDDFLTAHAPKPVCIGAAASDQYFPIEGVHEVAQRVRHVYGLYDAADRVTLTVADTTHCSVYELRDGVFDFLCDQLADREYEPHDDIQTLDESELHATPEGSVLASFSSERTIGDLVREFVEETTPDPATVSPDIDRGDANTDANANTDDFRQSLAEDLGIARDGCVLHPRFVEGGEDSDENVAVERVWFKTERHPDIAVTGVLVTAPETTTESPAVVLYEDGTEELPARDEDVVALAHEYGTVFVFDPRGVGAVRNRSIPIHPWVEDYDDIYGTEFKLAYDAMHMESSLLGMRVFDVLRAVEFLRSETESDRVSFVGEGIGAYHALYAAVAETGTVDRVVLRGLGPSFVERATRSDVPFRPQLTVFDVVGTYDVPQLTAALDQRGVTVEKESSR